MNCERPDRDVPSIKCGYPLPCPWHTAILEDGILYAPKITNQQFKYLKKVRDALK